MHLHEPISCRALKVVCMTAKQFFKLMLFGTISSWDYFSHDHARSRAYRWGEDGLLGITDRECRLCFGLALWNEKDPILKERLFGLTGTEGQMNVVFCLL